VPAQLHGAVAAIGNFDGVHRGHRTLIEAAKEQAARDGSSAIVLTFEPHPRRFFHPETPLFRLTPGDVKLAVLKATGLDGVVIRRFDHRLAVQTPEEFVDFLVSEVHVSGVVVGHDFHFGRGREGTPERLQELCRHRGLSCAVIPAVTGGQGPVSSTSVRQALEAGNIAEANNLLGYRWFVRGEVRHGDKRGRILGFPTANLRLEDDCRLRHGIYAVRAACSGAVHRGVASFGRRPTFDNGSPLLEVHLFDFAGDLYGQTIDVELVGWIRGEERFPSAEALVARMHDDARNAREILDLDQTPSIIGRS